MKQTIILAALACAAVPFSASLGLAQAIVLPSTITYRGAFDPTLTYSRGDQVYFAGALYVALYSHKGYSPSDPVNSATAGYAPESGGLPAWAFLMTGPLGSATTAGLSVPGNVAPPANPVSYFGGGQDASGIGTAADVSTHTVTVANVPAGAVAIIQTVSAGSYQNGTANACSASGQQGDDAIVSDGATALSPAYSHLIYKPGDAGAVFGQLFSNIFVVKNSTAGTHSYTYSPQSGCSNGLPVVTVAVVSGASATSPVDQTAFTTPPATGDADRQLSSGTLTPLAGGELAISFAFSYGGGNASLVPTNFTQPAGLSLSPDAMFSYTSVASTSPVTATWAGVSQNAAATADLVLIRGQ